MTALERAAGGRPATAFREMWHALRLFRPRTWLAGAAAGVATLVVIGVPTVLIPNPLFGRAVPPRPQDYVIWALTGLLVGLTAATYLLPARDGGERRVVAGGVLSFLAVGCPTCNQLAVLLLGTSGALTWFAPAQIYIGVASLLLLLWTLRLRARSLVGACPAPRPSARG